jgi:RimJ/RimL family protein N-acetyltransferase
MRIHIDALFTHDDRGRLLKVNEPDGKPAPRFFLGRTAEGIEWRVRNDVDDALERELAAVCREESTKESLELPPHRVKTYVDSLARVTPVQDTSAGPAFAFPSDVVATTDAVPITNDNSELLRPHFASWIGDVAACQPMLAVVIDGDAVSLCASVRITSAAHEAGIETALAFRGHGYGSRAATAWAERVRRSGRIALYSTSWDNIASRAVARKLGLQAFGSDFHIT